MDIRKLQRAIVDGLEDVKAQNIVVFNTEKLSPLFERVIIASGTSNRQTKALASSVRETVKKRGMPVMATEGEDNGEWIIVDCGAAVAHIMQPAIRDYYHLEELWGGKTVRLKVADGASANHARRADGASGKSAATAPSKTARPPAAATITTITKSAKSAKGMTSTARPAAPGRAAKRGPAAKKAVPAKAKTAAARPRAASKPVAAAAAPRRPQTRAPRKPGRG